MKRIILISIILIFSFTIIACQNQTLALDKKYDNSYYQINYPENWNKNDLEKIQLLDTVMFEIDSDSESENFGIVVEELNMGAEQYLQMQIEQLKSYFKDFKLIESNEVELDGQKAYEIIFSGQIQGKELKYLQLLAVKDSDSYILTYTARENVFSKYEDTISAMIDSFSFK